ncbi:hypothetical protein GUJ93_ZPchr0008g12091 [Zizania palustris]|uniref:26S proteasome complex subunit SEM1 n=1 Tax=Zizania palustris TaxID=103762 RepID=A0A8J5V0T2_ZIZPA|nr:hypothetical protein GUJ93_ZPchr0008g12091 [Zizania palustris]
MGLSISLKPLRIGIFSTSPIGGRGGARAVAARLFVPSAVVPCGCKRPPMAEATKADAAAEAAKMDLLEDDDEFEEFEIDQEWDEKEEGNEAVQQWEDDWDDDDVNDDFSLQLRKELESNSSKN